MSKHFSLEYVEAMRSRRAARREKAIAALQGVEPASSQGASYESPSIDGAEAELLALDLLQRLDGLPVCVVRRVLRQAEFWLDATTTLDCGATEFQRASEGFQAASAPTA